MSSVRRLAGLLLTVLAVLGLAGPAAAADGSTNDWRADRVLVIGVPGLAWSDLDPARTPALWALADGAAIGALSVRAARSTTCLLDGWATLGAGNRARFPGPAQPIPPVPVDDAAAPVPVVDASLSYCGLQEQVASLGLHDPPAALARVAEDDATVRFGAEPGALGDAVGCATVIGRAASLAAAGPDTTLDLRDALPSTVAETTPLLNGCPLTLVSLDQLTDAGRPGPEQTDTGTTPVAREEALADLDAKVGQLVAATAALPDTLLLVVGLSEVNDGRPQLHVGLAAGTGTGAGWLTSASTGRVPFFQLIDVAPTVLRALGIEQPASMNGQPVTATADRPALPEALALLHDANIRATSHYRSTGKAFWTLVAANAALVAAGVLVLGISARVPARGGRRARVRLRAACLAAAALPVATYLADLLPWQDAGSPRWALVAAVVAADLVVAAVAGLGPWRRRRIGPALAVLVLTLGTVVGDVLTGSHLELDGLLGYDAIVAGRFVGYGNLTFGLFSVSALLLTAAAAAALARRGRTGTPHADDQVPRRRWLLPVLLAGGLAVVLMGAPSLGRDFGGVLAAVPGFGVLGMLLARIRVTVVRLVAVLATAVAVVTVVAVLDWLRPAAERSHLGRFVAQALDGQAWTVVLRKGQANLSILVGSSLSWMLPVALVAAVWLLRPGGRLRSRPGRGPAGLPAADARVLRAGLTAAALSLAVGAAVNDSGVALPATAATLLVPLLIWLAAGDRSGARGDDGVGQGTPGSTPGGSAGRVSVSVRGSTG
ncbi:hypothetical protein SAMN05661080_01907 [Modestobacter sp. DSM 44400]|uniref:hypothetical protein n=1 Tax=Modestobacter sp. DSM 44400 TaxID=1550230 RepID=UPI0008985B37|nr:hypothetical protein [Modestobacter sp. DSM 44400]SDX98047.1 hypothetical protein SAMN05661080_01907 [Modestobacter sp. DSM 44400]